MELNFGMVGNLKIRRLYRCIFLVHDDSVSLFYLLLACSGMVSRPWRYRYIHLGFSSGSGVVITHIDVSERYAAVSPAASHFLISSFTSLTTYSTGYHLRESVLISLTSSETRLSWLTPYSLDLLNAGIFFGICGSYTFFLHLMTRWLLIFKAFWSAWYIFYFI